MKDILYTYEAKQERKDMTNKLFDDYAETMDSAAEASYNERNSRRTPVTKISGEIVRRTDKAILIQLDKENNKNDVYDGQLWIPLGLIPKLDFNNKTMIINECCVETWFLRSKGMLITG